YKGSSNVSSTLQAAKSVVNDLLTAIATDTEQVPQPTFSLKQPYPNPSTGRATVSYELGQPGPVRLSVLDLLGREVAILEEGFRASGHGQVEWQADDTRPAGLYLLVLEAEGQRRTRSILLNR
ncbi:MAG: T9SS type A sorting domain-containing protein, partial [Rhodothermales bacterium]|nr:T9SS type A sorting domain-containing protein [Rhodothermales bacterium]